MYIYLSVPRIEPRSPLFLDECCYPGGHSYNNSFKTFNKLSWKKYYPPPPPPTRHDYGCVKYEKGLTEIKRALFLRLQSKSSSLGFEIKYYWYDV